MCWWSTTPAPTAPPSFGPRQHPGAQLISLAATRAARAASTRGCSMRSGRRDWLWLMDDDTIPRPDALERAARGAGAARPGAPPPLLLASKVVWTDGRIHPMNPPGRTGATWTPWSRLRAGRGAAAVRDLPVAAGARRRGRALRPAAQGVLHLERRHRLHRPRAAPRARLLRARQRGRAQDRHGEHAVGGEASASTTRCATASGWRSGTRSIQRSASSTSWWSRGRSGASWRWSATRARPWRRSSAASPTGSGPPLVRQPAPQLVHDQLERLEHRP